MSTQKTPEQWFQQLKEPYRSEAIANIDKTYYNYKDIEESLCGSLYHSFHWESSKQGEEYWDKIHTSIESGETTYLEPELLKPEPIELRPEDLVSGEVYKGVFSPITHFIFKHKLFHETSDNPIYYYQMINNSGMRYTNGKLSTSLKFYHATPEEKALLGEETTDWEKKYNEIDERYKILVTDAHKLEKDSSDWEAKYNKMFESAKYWENRFNEYESTSKKEYVEMKKELIYRNNELYSKNEELQAKINQLEPKGEKVYFYTDYITKVYDSVVRKETAIELSLEDSPIYEAIVIGKKKSVLVSETT